MKINKKIIAVLVFAVVLISIFAILTFSASAYSIDDVEYEFKLPTGKITTTHDPGGSYSKSAYITVSTDDWTLSGNGSFGYDYSIDTWYIQIDKYAGANGSWLLKLDSDRYWKYRDGLDDYGTMHSTWHTMKTEPKDIYISFSGLLNNDDYHGQLFTRLPHTITFTGEGVDTYTEDIPYGSYLSVPGYNRLGYELIGWRFEDSEIIYKTGDMIYPQYDATFTAVWRKLPTYTITFSGEFIDTVTYTVYEGTNLSFPAIPTVPGYTFQYWQSYINGEPYSQNDHGGNMVAYSDISWVAIFKQNTVYSHIYFYYDGEEYDHELIEVGKGVYEFYDFRLYDDLYYVFGWKDQDDNFYGVGDVITFTEEKTLHLTPVMTRYVRFIDGDIVTRVPCDLEGNVTAPGRTADYDRLGWIFDGWSDGVHYVKVGETFNAIQLGSFYFYGHWTRDSGGSLPGGSGSGSDSDSGMGSDTEYNFITKFFSDTFNMTKDLCMPYLTSFEIPFLGITLYEMIRFVYFGLISFVVIFLVSKVLGAIL